MGILSIMAVTLIGVAAAVILKNYKPEFNFFMILIMSFLFLGWLISVFSDIKSELKVLTKFYEENSFYYTILLKITGITYLCEFTSGICKDAGYSSISTQIEMAGRILVLLASVPVILFVITMIHEYKI